MVHAVADHSAFAGTYGCRATDTPAEWRTEVHRTLDAAAALEGGGAFRLCVHAAVGRGGGGVHSIPPTTGG